MISRIIDSKTSAAELELLEIYDSSIFQSKSMFQVWSKTKNFEPFFTILEDDQGRITACLLAVIQKENSGFIGRFSSRSIIIGQPFYNDHSASLLRNLLKAYNNYISNKVIYSQFRNLNYYSSEEKKVFEDLGFKYEQHLDIIHDLTKPISDQFASLHKGRRKNIRRAEKAHVQFREIKNNEEFKDVYDLIYSTYARVKLPIPDESLFTESYNSLSKENSLKTFVATLNKEIIGARIILCYHDLLYDWYAGASEKHLNQYPNDFLPWKVMEWGNQNGYKIFDFGGAGKPNKPYGVRDFKMKFGGELVEFGRFEKIHNKTLMKIGKIGLKLYKYVK